MTTGNIWFSDRAIEYFRALAHKYEKSFPGERIIMLVQLGMPEKTLFVGFVPPEVAVSKEQIHKVRGMDFIFPNSAELEAYLRSKYIDAVGNKLTASKKRSGERLLKVTLSARDDGKKSF
jgi:hypothetical protein